MYRPFGPHFPAILYPELTLGAIHFRRFAPGIHNDRRTLAAQRFDRAMDVHDESGPKGRQWLGPAVRPG